MKPIESSFWLSDGLKSNKNFLNVPEYYLKRVDSTGCELSTNVVVIGAGLTGVSLAYWLVKSGSSVTLVDKREICGGATGRNGGHLWPATSESIEELFTRLGPERAKEVYSFAYEASDDLKAFISHENIQCDLTERGGLDLALSEEEKNDQIEGLELLAKANLTLPGLCYYSRQEIIEKFNIPSENANFNHYGGFYDPSACQIWPAKLVYSILSLTEKEAKKSNISFKILTCTTVTKVTSKDDEEWNSMAKNSKDSNFLVGTDQLDNIECLHVCHCTDGYSQSPCLLPGQWSKICEPLRGQVIVTEPITSLPWKGNIGSLCFNYSYEYLIHRSSDSRIVFGGFHHIIPGEQIGISEDHNVLPIVTDKLSQTLCHLLGRDKVKVDYVWTGIMGYSPDRLSSVGMLPNFPNQWVSIGTSGCGMPFIWGFGKCLAVQICRSMSINPSSEATTLNLPSAFSPSRFPY